MGTNFFLTFPAVPVGASGAQAPIDLFTLVGPTGLDQHLTFICKGDFIEGAIAVEASPDGVIWDVLGQFSAGNDADNVSGPRIELSPIIVDASVQFLRLNVQRGTKVRSIVTVTVGGEQNCECESTPVGLTCCPCAPPINPGPLDPQSFCTEFPSGVPAPFAITAGPDPGFSLGTTGDDIVLDFDGTQPGGALFLEAPGPLVQPVIPGSFCFCAVMAQNIPTPAPNTIGSYVGLTSGPFNESLMIVTADPTGASFATYQIYVFEGAGPTSFFLDTGIPIDGTLHKFVVCRGAGATNFILTVDNGASISFDPGFLPGPMAPFVGINAFGPAAIGNAFDLTVDSFCTSSLSIA